MLLNTFIHFLILGVNMDGEQIYSNIAKKFFKDIMQYEVKSVTYEKSPPHPDFLLYNEPIVSMMVNGIYSLTIGENSKKVLSCIERSVEKVEGEKVISVDDAFKQLEHVFKYYNLPFLISEYFVKESIDSYIFQKELLYDNVTCRYSGIRVDVLKKNGRIKSILYRPCFETKNKIPHKVDENEIKEIAKKWVKEQKYFQKYPAEILEEKTRIVIAPRFNFFDPTQYMTIIGRVAPVERYYVYEVPISWEEKEKKWYGWVWVDGNNNEVIGGIPDYIRKED